VIRISKKQSGIGFQLLYNWDILYSGVSQEPLDNLKHFI